MPSKGKKQAKSSASASPIQSPSPRTPSTPIALNLASENEIHESLRCRFLSAASAQYPSLISNTSTAFYGTVSESDSLCHTKGRYFAIATIFPSRKVLKNGVKLSWGLSCTMGFPSIGRAVFISPLTPTFCTNKCTSLYLNLFPSNNGHETESINSVLTMDSSSRLDDSVARLALEDDKIKELLQIYASRWLYGRYLLKGNVVSIPIFGRICYFLVRDVEGSDVSSGQLCDAFLVDGSTKVHLNDSNLLEGDESSKESLVTMDSSKEDVNGENGDCDSPRLGGLSKEFMDLKEIISFSLAKDSTLPRYKGVLLYGPPGTGKTSLACLCAKDAGANLFTINGPEIISQYYGESEQALHRVFDSAKKAAPAVVFIDELDAIALGRKEGGEELSLRMVASLLKLMDEINRADRMIVIAATNRPDSIDPALRRPGRLDREIEIGVPSPKQRLEILHTLLTTVDHSLTSSELESVSLSTHGFVGADLAALCNEAALNALRCYIKSRTLLVNPNGNETNTQHLEKGSENLPIDEVGSLSFSLSKLDVSHEERREEELKVKMDDFERAKMKIRPSAMREVMLELPKVRWEDVGGQAKVKKQLIEAVQWPQMNPDAFDRIGIRPPRGLLMIGPPGCSKTLMARAVASEAKLNFLAVKGPELFSKWVGESEKAVKSLFAKARVNAPVVIFFDEIDGLAVTRGSENDGTTVADRVLSQLLVEMDGLDLRTGVTVIAATNRPDKIDPALLRPGRFDRLLDVQLPDETDRGDIFRIHTKNIPCGTDVIIEELASLTQGYTGADIKLVCREAAIAALEQESFDIAEVSMRHFKSAIGGVRPSDLHFYQELATQFRRLVDSSSITNG